MDFKYIQLNTWRSGKLYENLISFLSDESPDIISLQEVFEVDRERNEPQYQLLERLKNTLKLPHMSFKPVLYDTSKETNQGTAVLSKFPILEATQTFYLKEYMKVDVEERTDHSKNPYAIHKTHIKIAGKEIAVISMHGVWGFDEKDNKKRFIMRNAIIKAIENEKYVILSGDLNVGQNTKTIHYIERYLVNIFKNELITSFNMKYKPEDKGGFSSSVVDYIFTTPNIKIKDKKAPQVNVSDHLPLVATFEI